MVAQGASTALTLQSNGAPADQGGGQSPTHAIDQSPPDCRKSAEKVTSRLTIFNGFEHGNFANGKCGQMNFKDYFVMACHPDGGEFMAVGLKDCVKFYETRTYSEIHELSSATTVSALAWYPISPSQKGKTDGRSILAVGGLDGKVTMYRIPVNLKECRLAELLHEFQIGSQVRVLSFMGHRSSDQSVVLAVGDKGGKVAFCVLSQNGVHRFTHTAKETYDSPICALAFSAAGTYLAVCTGKGKVTVHDISNLQGKWWLLWESAPSSYVRSIVFTHVDRRLLLGDGNAVSVVDTSLWAIVHELKVERQVNIISSDPLERYLAVGCEKSCILYDTSTLFPIKTVHTPGRVTSICWGEVNDHRDIIAVGSRLKCLSFFDLTPIQVQTLTSLSSSQGLKPSSPWSNSGRVLKPSPSWSNNGRGLRPSSSWSYNGRFLARIKDKEVIVSDSQRDFLEVARHEMTGRPTCVAFCFARAMDDRIATVDHAGYLNVLKLKSNQTSFLLESVECINLEDKNLRFASWSSDGELLATGGEGEKLHVLFSTGLKRKYKAPLPLDGRMRALDFTPQSTLSKNIGHGLSHTLAVGTGDNVTLYDDCLNPTLQIRRPNSVRCLSWHPSKPLLAIGDSGNLVAIVNMLGKGTVNQFDVSGRVNTLQFSPCGDFLAVGMDARRFTILETASFKIVQDVSCQGFAHSAGFNATGKYFFMGCLDSHYTVLRLGPFLGTEFIPLEVADDKEHPSWALHEALYRSGKGPSLLQRCIEEGSEKSMQRAALLMKNHSCTMFTFNQATQKRGIDTLLSLTNPNLLKLAMTMLVDGTLDGDCNGSFCLLITEMAVGVMAMLHFLIKNQPPQFTVDFLGAMKFTKVPFPCQPNVSQHIEDYECGSESYLDPWQRSCPHGWLSKAKRSFRNRWFRSTGNSRIATPAVLPLPGLGSMCFLSALLDSMPATAFDNDAMGLVISVLWCDHIRWYFHFDILLYVVYLCVWTCYVDLTSKATASLHEQFSFLVPPFTVIVIIMNTLFAAKEVRHTHLRGVYFRSLWNNVGFVSTILVYVYIITTLSLGGAGNGLVQLAVITALFLTMNLLSYLRGFNNTGWLVLVLKQNFFDMKGFLVVLVAILLGFTSIFRLLFSSTQGQCDADPDVDKECSTPPFRGITRSFLSTFELTILGSYETAILDESDFQFLAGLTFVLAVTAVLITALNTLIAVLSDSYAKVQQHQSAYQRQARVELIVEYLSMLPNKARTTVEKRTQYFHKLLEYDASGDWLVKKDDWQGGLNALRQELKKEGALSTERNIIEMERKMSQVARDLAVLINYMEPRLEQVSLVLNDLKKLQTQSRQSRPFRTIP